MTVAGPDEGGHQRAVEAAAVAAGIRDQFDFVGPIPDQCKWEIYAQADLFVLPSHSENFGVVVGEALAAGVPVISTRATPWSELEEHRCGWWIPTGSDALAEVLPYATSLSDEERKNMGQRGRALIERCYSWRAAAERILPFYESSLHPSLTTHC